MCKQIRDNDIPDHGPGDEPRIKAFVIADPVSFFPNKRSLQTASAPIQLWSSDHGGMGVRPEDVASVRENLPNPPELHRPANSGHLSFQFPCSTEVAKVMSFICTDPPGFDRTELHAKFNAQVLEFFRKHLSRTLITTRKTRQDCASIMANDTSAEAYSVYAGCVLNNSHAAFYSLYTRHLRDFPDEKHDAELKFKVGAEGNVASVVASGRGITDSAFLKKLEARLKVIRFLPPAHPEHEITYTFKFSAY